MKASKKSHSRPYRQPWWMRAEWLKEHMKTIPPQCHGKREIRTWLQNLAATVEAWIPDYYENSE
jgi:hypothetical protein